MYIITRILELPAEVKGDYKAFLISISNLFKTIFEVNETDNPTLQQYKKWNESLYADLSGDGYRSSFAELLPRHSTLTMVIHGGLFLLH